MMQLRLIGSLTSLTLCGAARVAQTIAPGAQKPSGMPKSAHQIFVEDQDDLRGPDGKPRFTEDEYHQRVKARSNSSSHVGGGRNQDGRRFQGCRVHLPTRGCRRGFLFAHILAMEAMVRGTAEAKWIAAATLDRYLQFTKQPQVFGTQYITDRSVPLPAPPNGSPLPFGRTLEPYNEIFLSDSVRTDFCVPILSQQHENVAMFNAGKWPRETMHPPCH
jgi:hypothetical protein